MRRLRSSSTVWGALGLWLLFLPALWLIPRQALFEILNAIVFSVAMGVVIGYRQGVMEALKQPIGQLRAGDALQIGVAIGWGATAFIFGALFLWRLAGKDDVIIDSGLNAMSRWVLITSGLLHLAASGSIDGQIPARAYLRSGIAVAIGMFLGTVVIMLASNNGHLFKGT